MSSTTTTWSTDTNTKSGSATTFTDTVSSLKLVAAEGEDAILRLFADEGDDNADHWRIVSQASTNKLNFMSYASGSWSNIISLDSTGNVGIGTATPSHKLHIESDSGETCNLQVTAQGAMGDAEGAFATFSATGNSVTAHTYVGVEYNQTSTSNKPCGVLQMESSDAILHYTWYNDSDMLKWSSDIDHIGSNNGTFVDAAASDERGKNIASSFTYGLSHINQLTPISFTYKDDVDSVKNLGFGAQTTKSIIPESVIDTKMDWYDDPNNTRLDMKYTQIIPILVKAIQELSVKVEALENA